MNPGPTGGDARFIWATRGRAWGFRFLRPGGLDDPLRVYEDAFSGVEDQSEVWRRGSDRAALRFPDPEGRRDSAGRVIPHDFVLLGSWADGITSFEEARRRLWTEVAEAFAAVWDENDPPAPRS